MQKFMFRHAAPWVCAWLGLSPPIQAAEENQAAAPERPALAAPFDQYRPWRDEPVRDWHEANDKVGEIGGWRTYLRESQDDSAEPKRHQH